MNKTVKGSLAGAAGIALLMGGFGSYALWTDSAGLGASSVSSGVLTIDANTDGAYADVSPGQTDHTWSANDVMVPGDVITYTQTFALAGTGKNLAGTVDIATAGMDTTRFSEGDLTRDVDLTITGAPAEITETSADSNSFTFDDPFTAATLKVVVTYTLDGDATNGTDSQNATATTPTSTITIAQTR